MTETKWHPVKGFEGAYEMTADGSAVRSVPRRARFGDAVRNLPPVLMKRDSRGRYALRNPRNGTRKILRPDQLTPVMEAQK